MTYSPPTLGDLARYWVSRGGTNLGIVGDSAHQAKGRSYHLGRSALSPTAYSRTTSRDRTGLTEAASAIDLGKLKGSYSALRAFSVWLVKRCQSNAPGTQDIREVIYTPDGKTVLRYDRERGIKSTPRPGEADTSHLWHTHVSWYRDSEKRAKVGVFAPYFVKEQVKEDTMPLSLIALVEAIQADEDKSDDRSIAKRKRNLSLLHGRVAPLEKAVAIISDAEVVLSDVPGVAMWQILTSLGFDPENNKPNAAAVIDKASPDQNRQLALLGFFAQPGSHAGVDYSLFERYYEEAPVGLTEGGQPTEGNWAPKDPSTSAWAAYQHGE